MVKALGIAFVIAAAVNYPSAQARQLQVWAEGLIVTHVQTRGSAAAPVFDFTIQYAGQPNRLARFFVTQAVSLSSIEVRRGLILVWGRNTAGHHTVDGIDGATGKSHFAVACSSFRLAPAQTRYLCDAPSGQRWSIDFATRRVTKMVDTVDGVLTVLRSGPLQARRGIVQAFTRTLELQENPVIRSAILDELHRVVFEDLQIAARTSAKTRIRVSSAQRDYLGEVIAATAAMQDPRALPSLVRADYLRATSVLIPFGVPAVRPILAVLRERPLPGVSIHHRAGLVEALVRIARNAGAELPRDVRMEILAMLPSLLDRPDSHRELLQTISLVGEVDEDGLVTPRLRLIAGDARFLQTIGIVSAEDVRQVQTAARRALGTHVVIR